MFNPMLQRAPSPALEALIQNHVDKAIRRDMVIHFEEWMSSGDVAGNFNGKTLSDIISRRLRLNIDFKLLINPIPNASISIPDIDKNNPLINGWRKYYLDSQQGRMITRWSEAERFASINLETGVASGFFTKIMADCIVTSGIIKLMTPGEMASILCHEIGHYVHYLAMLSMSMNTCFMLTDFVQRAMGNTEKQSRVKLMSEYEKTAGIRFSNKEIIEESTNGDIIGIVVAKDIFESTRNEFGSSIYDLRSFESVADNFVARLDGGAELSSAIVKLTPWVEPQATRNAFVYYLFETLKLFSMVVLIGAGVVSFNVPMLIMSYVILTQSPFEREYDKPAERIARIRRELVSQLKDKRIPEARRVKLKDDIDFIDHISATIVDRESFFEKFWLIISPYTRRQKELTKELQDLEVIVNNDLFVESNRLRTMA